MVLIGELLNNIKQLINQYIYTKSETRTNYNNFIRNGFYYINGELGLAEKIGQSLTLICDKTILSNYNSDTCTLTATLTGEDITGKTIEFFNGATSLGTAITDSNGIATKTYESNNEGYMNILAKTGKVSSEPLEIIDAKYYVSDEIISSAPDYNNDRTLFASDYIIQLGDKIHFRFKSVPYRVIAGIGSTQGSDFVFEKVGTTLKYWRNVLNNGSYSSPSFMFSTEYETVMEFLRYDSTQYKINLYNGENYVDYWRCGNSISRVRVDKFYGDECEIEVYVL